MIVAGSLFGRWIAQRIHVGVPDYMQLTPMPADRELPSFLTVADIILVPLALILINTVTNVMLPNPSITWADSRAADWAERIKRDWGGLAIYQRTGTPIHPMSPLAKLVWLRRERPEVFARAARFVGIKEYVFFRLFGRYVVDYSIASATGLFELSRLDWDAGALELAGITPERPPEPVPTTFHLAGLAPELARELGLLPTTPFVVGANDGVLSNLGVKAIGPGEVAVTIGTSGAMRTVVDRPLTDPSGRTFCYALTDRHWVGRFPERHRRHGRRDPPPHADCRKRGGLSAVAADLSQYPDQARTGVSGHRRFPAGPVRHWNDRRRRSGAHDAGGIAMTLHPTVAAVTDRIRQRGAPTRTAYLARLERARRDGPIRKGLSCTNLAHAFAAFEPNDKQVLREARWPNIAIVSSYNDMLSAHQPLERFPALIKQAAREAGAVAQFAGGVPAMCDGVTQGQPGMELSLFSRDVIAMATAVALSHDVFDAVLYLGVCDKIVPGLVIGALHFGHLPAIFVPGGPMPSGLPNAEKAKIRQLYAQGQVGRDALLEAESKAYHGPGTCTFYGTANSNQMLTQIVH